MKTKTLALVLTIVAAVLLVFMFTLSQEARQTRKPGPGNGVDGSATPRQNQPMHTAKPAPNPSRAFGQLQQLLAASAPPVVPTGSANSTQSGAAILTDYNLISTPAPTACFVASNPDQRFRVTFASDDVRVQSLVAEAHQIALRLAGIGHGNQIVSPEAARMSVQGNRIEYHRGLVREWYVNDNRGLEQGFTIESPLGARDGDKPLRVAMTLESELEVSLAEDGLRADFALAGQPVLRYQDLAVYDATGRALPAWLELAQADRLDIVVDDRTAAYPIVIDPLVVGLVEDINDGGDSSVTSLNPSRMAAVGDTLFFAADDGVHGVELWASDGTEQGTRLVKDIDPDGSSEPVGLLHWQGALYFVADHYPVALWRSDGTPDGTVMVTEFGPPVYHRFSTRLIAAGDQFFLHLGPDGLWRSDGTAAGTYQIEGIIPISAPPYLQAAALGNMLLFGGRDSEHNHGLWRTDGTVEGTLPLHVIPEGPPGFIGLAPFIKAGMQVYFAGREEDTDLELWTSDGTAAGTVRVTDFPLPNPFPSHNSFATVGDALFFTATDGVIGHELWKAIGTTASLVKDIRPGFYGSVPTSFTEAGPLFYFSADDGVSGRELWKSDGTAENTVRVADIHPTGSALSSLTSMAAMDGLLFFSATHPPSGMELWMTDGTAIGTHLLDDIVPGPGSSSPNHLISVGHQLFFTALDTAAGRELWHVIESTDEHNAPPAVNAGADLTTAEGAAVTFAGAFTDPDIGDAHEVVWDFGDGTTFSGGLQPTHTYADNGTYTVTLTVTDSAGASGVDTLIVMVANQPPSPVITAPASGLLATINTPIALAGTFTDPGTLDTHTAHWVLTSANLPEIVLPGSISGPDVTGQFTAAQPGVYSIRLVVTDGDGGIGETAVVGVDLPAFVVIYDPEGGFVTGGGWIWSPPGAFHPGLEEFANVEGRATFGFVAKYQKGATVPTGNTEFQFKAGDLNFHSHEYQWLVVAGARAQYKGVGTLNNAGQFGFILTAIDGQLTGGGGADRLRMKIWDTASGIVIYDNHAGAGDGASLPDSTILRGGSIVIHRQ